MSDKDIYEAPEIEMIIFGINRAVATGDIIDDSNGMELPPDDTP